MNFKAITLAIVLLIAAEQCRAKNILCLLGVGTQTTNKWNYALLNELEQRDHHLTVVTSNPANEFEDSFLNAEFIHLEKTQTFLRQRYEALTHAELLHQSTWKFVVHWYDRQMATCRANLESIGFSEALHLAVKEKRQYDLIIYDVTYGAGCLLHLAYLFGQTPIVGLASGHLNVQNLLPLSVAAGELLNPSLHPYVLSDFGRDMSYWRRWHNNALYAFDYLYRKLLVNPVIEGIWSTNMQSKSIVTPKKFDKLLPRFKAILANYHPSLHTLQSLPNYIVPVPGLHIQGPQKLNEDVLKFVESFKKEVILIDMEKNLLDSDHSQALLDVIKQFPNNGFVWINAKGKVSGKNGGKNLLQLNNVEAGQILGHDKVKCAIVLPELLNVQEALYHGVTPLTITTSPEQRYLAQRLLERKLGLNLELYKFDKTQLHDTLKSCLNDKTLHKNAQQFSASLKKQPNPSLETAIWWVEHISENPQAQDHLLDAKSSLSFLALRGLDILLVVEIFLVLCAVNSVFILRQTFLNFKNAAQKAKAKAKKSVNERAVDVVRKEKKLSADKKEKKAKAKTS
ncbi:UDP-glycosyltransferase UGT4 [Musca domestica]|uniref:UDP-glucuronosyltransferase 2A2 n=1 Tax=Musca domestica TaxID=7370 RepID=A0A1I8MGI2_MUSDO|nr:UDP-glycosyltransferase UGT4 [Musca domestica]